MPWLFSYGTLQLQAAQRETFGRAPSSQADRLAGYRIVLTRVDNPDFVAETGKALHNTLVPCAGAGCWVDGVALDLSPEELAIADAYERRAAYRRVPVVLMSGRHAWVYVVEKEHE
jgi:gamma-glutamylcyclotransferase (GGCT)/AIG2-like uncharacterized protein YtfP